MNYLKTITQYLCVGALFGLVGLVYAFLQSAELTGLWVNIPTVASVVLAFLLAKRVSAYLEPRGLGDHSDTAEVQKTNVRGLHLSDDILRRTQRTMLPTVIAANELDWLNSLKLQQSDFEALHKSYSVLPDLIVSKKLLVEIKLLRRKPDQVRLALNALMHTPSDFERTLPLDLRQMTTDARSESLAILHVISLDTILLNLSTTEPEKPRNERIKLQRAPLEKPIEATAFQRMLTPMISHQG